MHPLLDEVRGFLKGLRRELPSLFPETRGRSAPRKRGVPEELRSRIVRRAEELGRIMGADFRRVRVKDQRTLWGSCSEKRNLNFNWRLALAPDEVLDYVVVHELAHLEHLDHSRRFWELVARWCPEHRRHRRWLRKNGRALMRRRLPVLLEQEAVQGPARSEGIGHRSEQRAVEAG